MEKLNDNEFAVSVKEPPIDGRATLAIARAIAEHFGVSFPSQHYFRSIVKKQDCGDKIKCDDY